MASPRKMIVHFSSIMQISQEIGGRDDHMTAELSGTISVDGGKPTPFSIHVKQIAGDVADSTLEVGPPKGYTGPLDYMAFRDEAQKAYQEAVGKDGKSIRTGPGTHAFMANNAIGIRHTAIIPIPDA